MNKKTLHFLGSRSYLHSTTIANLLIAQYRIAEPYSLKLVTPIFSDSIFISPEQSENFSSVLRYGNGLEHSLYIIQAPSSPCPHRVEYDERAITEHALFTENTCVFAYSQEYTFLQQVVANLKELHNKVFSIQEKGQWLAVQIDMSFAPEFEKELRLELVNASKKLTMTKIFCADNLVGKIYFSWIEND